MMRHMDLRIRSVMVLLELCWLTRHIRLAGIAQTTLEESDEEEDE